MAIIIHPKRWSTQPPSGAQIDFGHPLAKGLTFYTLFNAGGGPQQALLPASAPETLLGTTPTPIWATGPDAGKSHNWNNNWSSWYERGSWVEPTNQVTCVVRLRRVGNLPSFSVPILKTAKNAGSTPFWSYGLEYNRAAAGQDVVVALISTSGTAGGVGTAVNLGAGATLNAHTLGMTYTSGALKLFYNGILKQTDVFSGTITYDTTSTGRLILSGASAAAAGNEFSGQIFYSAIWNRALTGSEMEWLNTEPYAMLVPTKRKKFFLPAPTRSFTYNVAAEKII